MRLRTLVLMLAAVLIAMPVAETLARSSGGSRSSSRSSFSSGGSRSSSSGFSSSTRPSTSSTPSSSSSSGWSSGSSASKPSTSTGSASGSLSGQSSPSSQSGWSNSSGASASGAPKSGSTSAFSSAGGQGVNRMAATRSYQDYQGQFAKSGNAVPGAGGQPILNPNRKFGSYNEYNSYRNSYYGSRGWSAPGYAFGGFSSFGMWDAMFLWFMMSHAGGSSFFYNHQNDPGVQAFQKEAQTLAASNEDLKKQVAEMNTKLDDLKKSGAPVDPKAMPADVDPNVALAKPPVDDTPKSSGGWFFPLAMGGLALALGLMLYSRIRKPNSTA